MPQSTQCMYNVTSLGLRLIFNFSVYLNINVTFLSVISLPNTTEGAE